MICCSIPTAVLLIPGGSARVNKEVIRGYRAGGAQQKLSSDETDEEGLLLCLPDWKDLWRRGSGLDLIKTSCKLQVTRETFLCPKEQKRCPHILLSAIEDQYAVDNNQRPTLKVLYVTSYSMTNKWLHALEWPRNMHGSMLYTQLFIFYHFQN